MNRNEAIEKSAQLFLQVLEHSDNRLTDSVFDYINILREALATPKPDAEPDAWLHHIVDPDGFVPDMRVSFSDRAILHEISREPLYTHPPQANAEPKRHRWDKDGERCKDCGDKDWTATAVCHPPKADAERVALLERIDNHMEDNSDLFDLLRDIRAYLKGGA